MDFLTVALLTALLRLSMPQHLAVAISGGPDSLALTLMLQDALRHTPHSLTALTVDHGLREASASEAEGVHRYCIQNKISHVTLKALDIKPGAMHHKARMARYQALALWCHQQGVRHLLLGHHLDDQLETFVMRLRRQSGPYGLGGMLPMTPRLGLWLWRPLLQMSKDDLVRCAQAYGAPFVCDPSNHHPHFERARIRKALMNLTPDKRHYWQRAQAGYATPKRKLFAHAETVLANNIQWSEGMAKIHLKQAPIHVWPHALRAVIEAVGGQNAAVLCFEKVCALFSHSHKRHTLGGCLITITPQCVEVRREWPRTPEMVLSGRDAYLWDDRFLVALCPTLQGRLRALGHSAQHSHLPYHLKGYPGLFHDNGDVTPFWETSVFRQCDWIQAARFPQTHKTLQRGA